MSFDVYDDTSMRKLHSAGSRAAARRWGAARVRRTGRGVFVVGPGDGRFRTIPVAVGNPMSSTAESVLIAFGIAGVVGVGYLLLTSKPASASSTGATGGGSSLLNVYSGTSGATYHIGIGQEVQFNLPAPDSGYSWIDTESGDSVLGGEMINTPDASGGWHMVVTVEGTGTQTITWTQEDSSGNPNPNSTPLTYTLTTS